MKKRFWKIEYSITVFVIFGIILLLIPSKFIASKEAAYIYLSGMKLFTKWNIYFSAMNAQADSEIVKSFKHTNQTVHVKIL